MTYYLTTVHSAESSSEYAALSIKNCPILYAIKQFSAKYYLGTEDRATAIKKRTLGMLSKFQKLSEKLKCIIFLTS